MASGRFVAYYRVSTDRQGRSGLGLDAQRKAVEDYLNGGGWQLVGRFTEVESGKLDGRPELEKALAACRLHKAKLVIAKLDRLPETPTSCSGYRRPACRSSRPTCPTPTTSRSASWRWWRRRSGR